MWLENCCLCDNGMWLLNLEYVLRLAPGARATNCTAIALMAVRGLQAGPLAKGLPMSLRRAVQRKAVPGDLEADLLRLAAAIEPLVPKVGHPQFDYMLF